MLILFSANASTELEAQVKAICPDAEVATARPGEDGYDALLARAEVCVGLPPMERISEAKNLRWLALGWSGVYRVIEHVSDHVMLTNAAGCFGPAMAEHVFGMMLAFTRAIKANIENQASGAYEWRGQPGPTGELTGQTCSILGLGDVGLEVAKRAKAFGMHVLAAKRVKNGKPDCVDELFDQAGMDEAIRRADQLVMALPGTPHTRRVLDARRLAMMKRSAYVFNVGRGSAIVQEDLVAALQSGQIAGAGLDVTDPEPLPEDHPLWRAPNCIISPHRSGATPLHGERFAQLFLENLRCYVQGEPLPSLVDREWGY